MGVDYSGKLMVGLHYEDIDMEDLRIYVNTECQDTVYEVEEDYEEVDWLEVLEAVGFTKASPYYDAELEDCIIGVEIPDQDLDNMKFVEVINTAREKFKYVFDKTPKLIGTQHIW